MPRNVNSGSPDARRFEQQIAVAVETLSRGGVVAIPTDTLYGLAAAANNQSAVERLFQIKGRAPDMALPLLLADVSDIEQYAIDPPATALRLAERFWPGPLTLVVRKAGHVLDVVTGGGPTVGLRVPDHDAPRAIARSLGYAITGTSANLSGQAGCTTARAVREQLGNRVDFILDGGPCHGGVPSTVLDLTGSQPKIVREGAVSWQEIEDGLRKT